MKVYNKVIVMVLMVWTIYLLWQNGERIKEDTRILKTQLGILKTQKVMLESIKTLSKPRKFVIKRDTTIIEIK